MNREVLADMRAHFNRTPSPGLRIAERPKGRLILVRTFLPTAVRAHRSSLLTFEQGLAQFVSSDSESDEFLIQVRRRFRSRRWRNVATRTASAENILTRSDSDSGALRINTPPPRRMPRPLTHSAVSMLYAEHGDPQSTKVWEIGCWAGTHQLAAGDMLHLYIDVLAELATIPMCHVDELCIGDNLHECNAVIEGVNLLKDISAELHAFYDKTSDYFIHPMTDRPVQIVLGR